MTLFFSDVWKRDHNIGENLNKTLCMLTFYVYYMSYMKRVSYSEGPQKTNTPDRWLCRNIECAGRCWPEGYQRMLWYNKFFCIITVKRYQTLRVIFNKVPKTSNTPKDQLHYCWLIQMASMSLILEYLLLHIILIWKNVKLCKCRNLKAKIKSFFHQRDM